MIRYNNSHQIIHHHIYCVVTSQSFIVLPHCLKSRPSRLHFLTIPDISTRLDELHQCEITASMCYKVERDGKLFLYMGDQTHVWDLANWDCNVRGLRRSSQSLMREGVSWSARVEGVWFDLHVQKEQHWRLSCFRRSRGSNRVFYRGIQGRRRLCRRFGKPRGRRSMFLCWRR